MFTSRVARSLAASSRIRLARTAYAKAPILRAYATVPISESDPDYVTIVEVGPRDGLQNEETIVSADLKVELIEKLARAGLTHIEAGSFVSPKWVPQMEDTIEVINKMERLPGRHYPVLVPNMKGLDKLLETLARHPKSAPSPPPTDEIAIFSAASDVFSKANTNCTVAEGLARLEPVARKALDNNLQVRGAVITCPYSGKVDPKKVKDVTKALLDMGCYEVSLGDTVGTGNPTSIYTMLDAVMGGAYAIPPSKLAAHFHDTFGSGVANILVALSMGIRTVDTAVAGLGGCPYSPGATGNVATEDVMYALRGSQYTYPGDLETIADIGAWISEKLEKENGSRAGKAIQARKKEAALMKERERDGGDVESIAAHEITPLP
ncbi:unnamed protein product [Somion occarium]|uniref:hydroxymethylglutaryl-CoA lyase n=1 Tax=Somion occarium TaxID=3059160 RepID=A0ABP1DQJ0_9APHY